MKNSKLHTLVREPLLHFLLIGAALFLFYNQQNEDRIDNTRIVISQAQINHLSTLWEKKRQRLPTQTEMNGMIQQQIREEVMYREALAMGLDQNDNIIRRRLAQKLDFITSDLAALAEPTEIDLRNYLATHGEKFNLPARINFAQVFISPQKHGVKTDDYAHSLLIKLKQTSENNNITTLGDSLLLDPQYKQITEHNVSRLFGKEFANNLFALPVDGWQGPIQSGYGFHLVRIDHKVESQRPELKSVREKVRAEWQSQQRREMDKAFYESLRQRYEIIIEK